MRIVNSVKKSAQPAALGKLVAKNPKLYLYLQEGGHLAKGTRLAEEVAKKASSKIAKGSKLIQNPYKNVDHL
ncbi:MAG: hypothetical protein AAF380_00490, partial [Bacteroidota bacterium]